MKLLKRYYQNLKALTVNEIFFCCLLPLTLLFIVILNKVFRSSNLYGAEIFHLDSAFKNQILIILFFFILYLITSTIKKKISLNLNSKKIIYFIFSIIILYKIYLYGIPFDFGNIQIVVDKYFVDNRFNYYKSTNYLMLYLNNIFDNSQIINSSLQVLFGTFSLVLFFLLAQKYEHDNNLIAILTVFLLIIYMPWNMVETLIGPDPLFALIFYFSIYLTLSTEKKINYKQILLLNFLFLLGSFTKNTFNYLAPLLILYIIFMHVNFKALTSVTLIANIICTSMLISNININKYGIDSFYKNQVYLLKIMTYGYLNPNIRSSYEESLTVEAKKLLIDIDYNYKKSVTPHKREPFVHNTNPQFWSYIRPDYESIKLKGFGTEYKADLDEIMTLVKLNINIKQDNNDTHISNIEIINLLRNVKKQLKNSRDKEMLEYIKFIVYDGYLLDSKMCMEKNLNQYSLKCVHDVFSTMNHNFISARGDDNFYKMPAIEMATKYDTVTKTYTSHPNIDSVKEILLKKPLLYVSQSILSFFGNTGIVPIPTGMGEAHRIFKENKTPKWFYKEAQRIFFPIINYWYVYCVFLLIYSILFINDLSIRYKNILFSIIPLYFGALISFFSMGEVPRQMLLVMPFIFYNFLVVMNFIFSKMNCIIFNTQYEKY